LSHQAAKEQREAHGEIETEHPGYLGAQDTYYVGTIKGIGRIYQQTFIDTYAKIGFAKLYTSKHAITAADLLNDRVLPWYEEQSVRLLRILTDRGTEYNGSIENHEYQLYLAIEDIDHSKTKARHPQTNGICERFHRTIKEEFYDIAFRKKIYTSLDDLQADLDQWMAYYNAERPHSGKYCDGRTPNQTFSETKHLADEKMIDTLFPKEVAPQDSSSVAVAA
jgi:transposase InsO family protein